MQRWFLFFCGEAIRFLMIRDIIFFYNSALFSFAVGHYGYFAFTFFGAAVGGFDSHLYFAKPTFGNKVGVSGHCAFFVQLAFFNESRKCVLSHIDARSTWTDYAIESYRGGVDGCGECGRIFFGGGANAFSFISVFFANLRLWRLNCNFLADFQSHCRDSAFFLAFRKFFINFAIKTPLSLCTTSTL